MDYIYTEGFSLKKKCEFIHHCSYLGVGMDALKVVTDQLPPVPLLNSTYIIYYVLCTVYYVHMSTVQPTQSVDSLI